jgi:methylmalonyl-CoA mutase
MKKLFEKFPPVSTESWEEKIKKDLKGGDYHKKLIKPTYEGFEILPYYREENLKAISYLEALPGQFPYVRSHRKENNSWLIRQDIKVKNLKDDNQKALEILMKGVDSLGFDLSDYEGDISEKEIEVLTKNIFADTVELNFKGIKDPVTFTEILVRLAKKYNRDLEKINGEIDFDPLGEALVQGHLQDDYLSIAQEMISRSKHLPHFHTLVIKANHFHNAGATLTQEIAYALAQAVDYLHFLTDEGLSVREIIPKMKFHFAVGSEYFMEIAKFRALRYLFAHIVSAYGLLEDNCARMYIHAETSLWNKTIYDPYVNLLRSSTEALSSILSGVDSLRIIEFNTPAGEIDETAERIARNQQLIMKHESYLDQVIDPAAGSYYIENLTQNLIESAWSEFLKVQQEGGFKEAIQSSFIQSRIASSSKIKQNDIAYAKKVFLGTNRFPNQSEHLHIDPKSATPQKTKIEKLNFMRGAEAFEKLRLTMDAYAFEKYRPGVFLLTFGDRSMRRARMQFAANFFAVAGFEILEMQEEKSLDQAVEEAISKKAAITVFCSSDQEYSRLAEMHIKKLKVNSIPVIAGNPAEQKEYLQSIGIEHYIHNKSNILEVLGDFVSICIERS